MRHGIFDVNPSGRDFFVGDLHGMHDDFLAALDRVGFAPGRDRVFSVGDLIDRGPASAACLRLLAKPWFHAVKGNHEDMMLGSEPGYVWRMNGGGWIDTVAPARRRSLRALIHWHMFDKITVATPRGRIGLVHADALGHWRDVGVDQLDPDTAAPAIVWGRTRIFAGLTDRVAGMEAVVVGHTVVERVRVLGNVVYIDTGACFGEYGGGLTLLEASDVLARVREAGGHGPRRAAAGRRD